MILLATEEFQKKFLEHYGLTQYEDGLGSMINISILERKEYAEEVLNIAFEYEDIDEALSFVRDEISFRDMLDLQNY